MNSLFPKGPKQGPFPLLPLIGACCILLSSCSEGDGDAAPMAISDMGVQAGMAAMRADVELLTS